MPQAIKPEDAANKPATVTERLTDPEDTFDTPQALLEDRVLTAEEKRDALRRWEESVQARLAASAEGMPTNETTPSDLDLLSAIGAARRSLRNRNPG